jgi:PKD repeat protein
VAIINAPTNGLVGEPITFDAGNSMPGDSPIDRYEWEFGDGDTANAVRVDHAYNSAGNFRVTLRVIDEKGQESTARSDIQIEPAEPEAPPPTEEPPPTETPPAENLPEAEPLPDEGEGQ